MIVNRQQLVVGFREDKRFKLGVKMRSLDVAWTDDEALSDDALESTWQFRVKTQIINNMKIYKNNRLGSGTHVLPNNLDYPLLEMGSDADELVIEVTGEDWDFWSSNDVLPAVNKRWKKGTDLWGARSTDVPGGAPGDHIDGPHRNDDIEYSLRYTTRVDAEPREQVFRTVC